MYSFRLPYIAKITDFEKEKTYTESNNFIIKQDYPRDVESCHEQYGWKWDKKTKDFTTQKKDKEGFRCLKRDEVDEVSPFVDVKEFWVRDDDGFMVYNKNTKKYRYSKTTVEEHKMVTIKNK